MPPVIPLPHPLLEAVVVLGFVMLGFVLPYISSRTSCKWNHLVGSSSTYNVFEIYSQCYKIVLFIAT